WRGCGRWGRRRVGRGGAPAAAGSARKLAASHMDNWGGGGLLRFPFLPPGGPGVGRRPKFYDPADESFQVSLPARQYEVLAGILVEAMLTDGPHESTRQPPHTPHTRPE